MLPELTEVGSGAKIRPRREALMQAARRRDIDLIVVWKLDRWGRSVPDLVVTLNELRERGVGFVSLTEALDFTTPSGRAMAGLLFAEFERDILRERVKAALKKRARGAVSMADRRVPGFTRKKLENCTLRAKG